MKLIVTLCVALAAACSGGKSRCEALMDKSIADCIQRQTQKFYVDGKEAGQLQSDEEARKTCNEGRAKRTAKCEQWPKEVLECAEKQYSNRAEWELPRCQQILEDNYKKEHPDK